MGMVGTLVLACPECGVHVDVPVSLFMDVDEYGRQEWWSKIDDADLWAHSWSHDQYLIEADFDGDDL